MIAGPLARCGAFVTRPRIAFVTDYDATDVSNFSGVGYFVARTLERHVGDVTHVLVEPGRTLRDELAVRLYSRLRRCTYFPQLSARTARGLSDRARRVIDRAPFDLVFCPGSLPVAFLDTALPLVLWKDSTFGALTEGYYADLCPRTLADGHRVERASLARASLVFFASDWGAVSARADYGLDEGKAALVPWGANLERDPGSAGVDREANDPLEVLLVGRPWERKGGDVALETLGALRGRGVEARLTIVGCTPPGSVPAHVTVHPSLDKRDARDGAALDALYRTADFLLLPSRHEAYGVVLCEANAFGCPVLASHVGGIPTIVVAGVNGFTLPNHARGEDYARKIVEILAGGEYRSLRRGSRAQYEERLNWDVAGQSVASAVAELLARSAG